MENLKRRITGYFLHDNFFLRENRDELRKSSGRLDFLCDAAFFAAIMVVLVHVFTELRPFAGARAIFITLAAFAPFYLRDRFQKKLYFTEKKRAGESEAALAKRSELLRVMNEAAVLLLTYESGKFESVLLKSMEKMARCVEFDQVHIWKNYIRNGVLYYYELFEWRENAGFHRAARKPMEFAYKDSLPMWEEAFTARRNINGPLCVLSKEEFTTLAPYGIVSILAIPVFLHEKFWGFISFDDCTKKRAFDPDDVSVLKSGSFLLVNAIVRHEMAMKMREADDRVGAMLNSMPLSCFLLDKDFRVVDCNEEAIKVFRPPHKQNLLEEFITYFPERQPNGGLSIALAREHLSRALRCGSDTFEWLHQTRDEEPLPMEVTMARVRRRGDYAVAVYARDLRETKDMTASLDDRLAQQELMYDVAQSFISTEDMSALITNALRKLGEFLKVSRVLIWVVNDGDSLSRLVYSWFSSEISGVDISKIDLASILRKVFPDMIPAQGRTPILRCADVNSDPAYEILSGTKVRAFIWAPLYVDGKYWGMLSVGECGGARAWSESEARLVGMISNVIAGAIHRARVERERAEALSQAVSASRAKSDFLSNMSHEIRTPMNAIIGMTAIGKASSGAEKKDYALDKIDNASTHLLKIINDILDMSKIEANKLELSLTNFDFEAMFQRVVNVINFKVEEKKQAFHVRVSPSIPRMLVGDEQRITQVITNLLANSVKFTPDGGSIYLSAKLLGEREGTYTLQFDVRDTGIGVTKDQQNRLFNPFEQAENSTFRRFGGTGLGLSISKRLVEMMGGRIWVDSAPGRGATFSFTICAQVGYERPESYDGVNWSAVRALVVGGEPEARDYLMEIMTNLGAAVRGSGVGEEALGPALEENYNVCFVDLSLPDMEGIEIAKRIKAAAEGKAKPAVIITTSANLNLIGERAKSAGADKILPRPFFPSQVAELAAECLGLAQEETCGNDERRQTGDAPDFEGCRILLADDVDINREIVQVLLEPTGVIIDCAENGGEAVRLFTANPGRYGMIFMDVQMPEVDGYAATRQIRALGTEKSKNIPIVAMTANVFKEDIEKCLESGMNDHIGKPLDTDELMGKLTKYLKKK